MPAPRSRASARSSKPRNKPQPQPKSQNKPQPPTSAPLPAEVLTRPEAFGAAVVRSGAGVGEYWLPVLVAALLSGLSYALLLRPGLNLAAEAARAAGQGAKLTPPLLTHVTNVFGSVFLTALTFGLMWGLGLLGGRLGSAAGETRRLPVAQVFSATFTLPILLSVLTLVLVLLTPAASWALDPAQVSAAYGAPLALQRAALASAARTSAALVLIGGSLLVTAAQCVLAGRALRGAGAGAGAWPAALLPLLPALGVQLVGLLPLLVARFAAGS